MTDRIEIPTSKTKLIFAFVGSLVFVIIGVVMLYHAETNISEKVIATITITFFGLGAIIFPKKILEKGSALIIDSYGITDNVTKPTVGTIEWNDITVVEVIRFNSVDMLLIFVEDPDKYLNRVKGFNSEGLRSNYKMVGTPFAIPSSLLKMKLEDIEVLINERLEEYRQVAQLQGS